jgi:hypothetical protein
MRRLLILVLCGGCSVPPGEGAEANPFLDDQSNTGKVDTAYQNPDGVEVEVDLEADVEGPAYSIFDGPAMLGQFAMTTLRKRGEFYLESLAEDATSEERVEWLVDGEWITTAKAKMGDRTKLKHFRLRAVNAVLLHSAGEAATEGKVFTAPVPQKPFSVMSDAGESCADSNDHISLSQGVYWYRWEADNSACKIPLQDLKLTVSKVLPKGPVTYPEYDRLVEDKKLTAVVLFGKIDDGEITEYETGMRNWKRMQTWLAQAGFTQAAQAPVGVRMVKTVGDVAVEIDLYSPHDFSGLSDYAHWDNFQRAISEHEIVTYDGHSMLGASDYWARPTYPGFYQMFLYGGCLGYEYYVRPILGGKGGWKNVDIVSSTIEVSVSANEFAGPILSKLIWALDHGFKASWKDILVAVRQRVGDSTFGVSGVRDNCFTPAGSRCE